ncbi:hypothetical protein RDJLphi1_gp60 [Roseobacter phage RDJL Phi 1]|uniref:Uncharacterized protein n=1 Tax=Roseobacter phage RDJL Phi 1 TaxID=562742 RepID=F4YXS1_9CAUD|nr:hypothetical protein RDJLphi1_gp60 [Roseobacter phage RDJL Phi 1]ADK73461.1 hypothetical protein RDJLphi1_gp60 [Roseobacter phage RDJL Phi 1]
MDTQFTYDLTFRPLSPQFGPGWTLTGMHNPVLVDGILAYTTRTGKTRLHVLDAMPAIHEVEVTQSGSSVTASQTAGGWRTFIRENFMTRGRGLDEQATITPNNRFDVKIWTTEPTRGLITISNAVAVILDQRALNVREAQAGVYRLFNLSANGGIREVEIAPKSV